jgi:Zn-dependent M16 (insulinase) family peptidase
MICEREAISYICDINTEDLQAERDEILSTKQDDIRKLAPVIEEGMKQNYLCVLGGKEKIQENVELFNNTINIFD